MNAAERQTFWEDDFPKYGIRLGRQMSYLDTKTTIGS